MTVISDDAEDWIIMGDRIHGRAAKRFDDVVDWSSMLTEAARLKKDEIAWSKVIWFKDTANEP